MPLKPQANSARTTDESATPDWRGRVENGSETTAIIDPPAQDGWAQEYLVELQGSSHVLDERPNSHNSLDPTGNSRLQSNGTRTDRAFLNEGNSQKLPSPIPSSDGDIEWPNELFQPIATGQGPDYGDIFSETFLTDGLAMGDQLLQNMSTDFQCPFNAFEGTDISSWADAEYWENDAHIITSTILGTSHNHGQSDTH